MNNFKCIALNHVEFERLNKLSTEELSEKNIMKMTVDKFPGFPCRITLEDAEIGEEVFLLSYKYHSTASPYQAEGPVFIRQNKMTQYYPENTIPKMFLHRLLSLRAYDKDGMMIKADVLEGHLLKDTIELFFNDHKVEYLHIHNAKPGCFNCKVIKVKNADQ